jgi:hypothetical protein
MTTEVKPGQLYEILPDGRWAVFFDASMIKDFRFCEQYFMYQHVNHINSRGDRWDASVGSWWSRTMELFYNALGAKDLTKGLAVELATAAWDELSMDRFKETKDSVAFGGASGAIVMISEYFDYAFSVDSNWTIIGAERGFGRRKEVIVGENDKVVVYYIGKPDLLIIEQGRYIPIDHKTRDRITPTIHAEYKPHPQTAGYIVAANVLLKQLGIDKTVDRCMINVAARKAPTDNPRNGKKAPRFTRVLPHYSPQELEEWKRQTVASATRLRYCIENNEWIWNSPSGCHLYSGCSYRPIDSVPEGSRDIVIQSQYNIGQPWVPYEIGED